MLQLVLPEREYFNDITQEFTVMKKETLQLEHSLISISKWESKWKKPFLSDESRSLEESKDYVKCMTLNSNVNDSTYDRLEQTDYIKISQYIDDKMSATWFNERQNKKKPGPPQTVTSELIYYWMIAYNIPFECQKWHLNRLLTLIRICEIKNSPSKKMSKKEIYARNRALNEARKSSLGTKG